MAIAGQRSHWKIKILLAGIISFSCSSVDSQVIYHYFYRVYLKDKGSYSASHYQPSDLLSQKAVTRRNKAGIEVPDYKDLPVNRDYLNQIASLGFTLHCTSKWMNTALFKTGNEADINLIKDLPFVLDARIVKRPALKGGSKDKLQVELIQASSPSWDNPVAMVNGQTLHNAGYNGKGLLIAVMDGGFLLGDKISSLDHLRARKGILATKDFVLGTNNVYSFHNHGTAVLSVLAGLTRGEIEGSAPGADFCLLRTEDTFSEYPVEEDYWAAGAEFADSIGADIISSSLGYFQFDDSSMNYKFADMNGHTAFVTLAAEAAASKGILVVTSAGNERMTPWVRIIAPTDGDSILSAGAVDGYDLIASFSSSGPSADGRVKPDNVAQGVSVPVQVQESTFSRANGTSFSCPVLSGICACAMQAVPEALNFDIIKVLHESGDRSASPDSLYGYGLPDMVKVVEKLENKFLRIPESQAVIGPNPFSDRLEIVFMDPPGSLELGIYDISGKAVVRRSYPDYISRTLELYDLAASSQGIYIIRLKTARGTITFKVTRIDR